MHHEFLYFKPEKSSELFELMEKYPKSAIMAGGTDLLVQIKKDRKKPSAVIDIKAIEEFKGIYEQDDFVFIGALTTITELGKNEIIKKYFPVFCEEVDLFACYELSNRATIGGNIAHSSPCADTPPVLLVLESLVILKSSTDTRQVSIDQFFTGVGKNIMKKGEVIQGFLLPKKNIDAVYMRADRVRGMDLASVNTAVSFESRLDNPFPHIRVAFGAVAPTPVRAVNTEVFLDGKELTDECIREATEKAMTDISPISDARGSKIYRTEMVKVLLERSLKRLRGKNE